MFPMNREHWFEYIDRTAFGRKHKERPLTHNTRVRTEKGGHVFIKLHNTDIIELNTLDQVILNTGGWYTPTTKARMNDYTRGLGINIWQQAGSWYLTYGDSEYHFEDGMVIGLPNEQNNGAYTVAGAELRNTEKEREIKRLSRRVNSYCKKWAHEFVAGRIPKPNTGDCWMCLFVDGDGKPVMGGTEHLMSHMDERYYVPSLLTLAMTHRNAEALLSPISRQFISHLWSAPEEDTESVASSVGSWGGIVEQQVYTCLRRYMRREFKLSQ